MKTLFIALMTVISIAAHTQHSIIDQLEQHYLSNFEWECDSLHSKKEWTFNDFLKNAQAQQKNLKETTKAKIVFKILNANDTNTQKSVLVDSLVWDDLCLFRNLKYKKAKNFAQRIDRTYSTIGKITFNTMLAQPTCNIDLLLKRQEVIRTLVNDNELLQFLDVKFNELKQCENLFLSFYSNDPLQGAIQEQYIDFNKKLNYSETALKIKNLVDQQKRIILFGAKSIASIALPIYGLLKILDKSPSTLLNKTSQRLISSGDALLGFISLINNNQVQGASAAFAGLHCALDTKKQYASIVDNLELIKYMREKLIHANKFLSITQQISDKLKNHENIYCALNIAHITNLLNAATQKNQALKQLLNLLNDPIFNGKPKLVTNWARILLSYKLFDDLKNEFYQFISIIGQIEAFTAMAKLYKEYENKDLKYCFVQFEKNRAPFICLNNFWNPIIDESKVVTNSVCFGCNDSARNIIISGPNEGGKSTIMRTIMLNILLAQTFGIACGTQMNFTIFDKLGSYINITDDLSNGNSLFKSQANRATHLIDQVKKLKDNQFWLLLFDEPFNGTASNDAQAIFYSIAKKLSEKINNVCLISTHFPKLSELEAVNNKFANYHTKVQIQEDGQVKCDYLLQKGACKQNTAKAILRSKGLSKEILDDIVL